MIERVSTPIHEKSGVLSSKSQSY